jgi:DNA polymerase-3 subunit epsilon
LKTIILDTESNGMRPEQLCQLSYIIAEDGTLTGRNFFFSVSCMNEYAQKKHGFSKKRLYDLSHGRSFSYFLGEIREDFDDADLICGHNIASDVRMLKMSYLDGGIAFPKIREFCTMAHFDNAMHLVNKYGKHKPPRLEELCAYMGLTDEGIQAFCTEIFGKSAYRAHDARFDAAATYLCIQEGQNRGDLRGVI